MKNPIFHLPEGTPTEVRRAFLITEIMAVGHFIAALYYLSLGWTTGTWQFYALAGICFALGLLFVLGSVLSRRGQSTLGMTLALGLLAIAYPPLSSLVSGLGLVIGPALMTVGPMAAFQVLPRRSTGVMTIVTVGSGLATLLLDVFGSATRPSLPGFWIQILAGSVFCLVSYLIIREFRRIWTRVSYKLIAIVILVLIITAGFQIVYSNFATRQNLEQEAREILVSFQLSYETKVKTESLAAEALALSIANRSDVQELYLRGDRDGLYDLLTPLFTQWKDRQIVHLYLENLDGTVFLRVHNPEKFGDDIKYRGTASTALNERRVTSGVEIGPSRLGVRGVAPMYSADGQFIGLAEVGADFDEKFVHDLHATTGADYTMWVLHEAAAIPNLKPAEGTPASPIEELFYYTSSSSEILPVDPDVYRSVLETGEPAFRVVTRNTSVPSTVYIVPLLGYGDKVIGLLEISEPYTDDLKAQNSALLTTLAVTAGLTIMGLFLIGFFSTRVVIQPLILLSQFAIRQMSGEIGTRVSVKSGDEFQQLAETFNSLASSVEQERMTLEERVAERTHSLELAAEVSRSVSQVRALDIMLKEAAELIRSRFDLYYVQVYLTNPARHILLLKSGTGTVGTELVGRGHRLPIDSGSINGRAALERHSVVIANTASNPSFRPNPLLPDTRSEMAVPLMIAENVVGVLDLQSRESGSLNDELLPAFEALAGQLAIAIQNASLLAETEQARAEVEAQARRLARTGWSEYMDAIHKPERIGFVFDRNQLLELDETDASQAPAHELAISAPIAITGEALGSLVVEIDDETKNQQTAELVNIVARQVAQQIENLRLLESAERYRYEAEQAARRQTIEGWQAYANSRTTDSLGYLFDLNQVRPYSNGHEEPSSLTLPLKARGETVGKLSVQGLVPEDRESLELANAVAEQLGAHIEHLRLFEETKQGQVELNKRAQQLAAVAEISTASSKELDIQSMLESVVHLTQRKFGLYHAHVFLYNEQSEELKIAACGWKEADEHEGTHETATIPVEQAQSLVARAARTRKAIIVNDVQKEPDWLPNPSLPDTAAEMAVPLVIGDRILGVLNVQSNQINAFTEEDANIQTTLASQVATALQNARSFVQAQKQAKREAMLNVINQKIQSATSVEAVLQIAARELGHALGAPMTIAQLSMRDKSS